MSVLRDGSTSTPAKQSTLSADELVGLMVGRAVKSAPPRREQAASRREVLGVQGLSRPGYFDDVSFTIREGEVVGLAGLVGAGRSEVVAALFGVHPATSGHIRIREREVRIDAPRSAIRHGIGLVPEDRKRQGIIPDGSCRENVSLAMLKQLSRLA